MQILFTAKKVHYSAPGHSYGQLVEMDWETRRVLRSIRIPAASFQCDQAFMETSLNGIAVVGSRIFVAGWNFIFEVDYPSFQIVNCFSHALMADLHGLAADERLIYAVSTAVQALLCFDSTTFELIRRWGPDEAILAHDPDASTPRLLARLFGARGQSVPAFEDAEYRHVHKSRSPYHRHHLNDLVLHNGRILLTTKGWFATRRSAVISLDAATWTSEFLVSPGGFSGIHDPLMVGERLYVTQSGSNSVGWLDPDGRLHHRRLEPDESFVRGLAWTGDSFLVGMSGTRTGSHEGRIAEFNSEFTECRSEFSLATIYPGDMRAAVHSIVISPTASSRQSDRR